MLRKVKPIDLAVFSPPYPNSFDYTDVYNVELWALGYLDGPAANTRLRLSTLASHVQIKRPFAPAPQGSALLKKILRALQAVRAELWDGNIPNMVGAYFADMVQIVTLVAKRLPRAGQAWMVVGDSGYAGVRIPVAEILAELASGTGCRVVTKEPFRSMRASAQQGVPRVSPKRSSC